MDSETLLARLPYIKAVTHPVEGEPIHLRPNQIPHFIRSTEIYNRSHGLIDLSRMGLGKSINVIALARYFGLPLGIIGPISSLLTWQSLVERYKFQVNFMIGYQALRSVKGKQPSHGLLRRVETSSGVHFTAEPHFTEMVKKGMILVIDEFHHIKNDSDQHRACRALTMEILRVGGSSRFSLLSGSPVDKEEHVVNLLRLIGYIRHPLLSEYNKERAELKLLGAQELIDVCRQYDNEGTEEVIATCPFDHKTVSSLCFRLYTDVIQDYITSAIRSLASDNQLMNVRNGYFNMSPQAEAEYQNAINEMCTAARFNPVLQTINRRNANFGAITTALMHSEKSKLEIFERIARMKLADKSDPNTVQTKVIIFLNFVNSILTLAERMKDLNPLLMYGATPDSERDVILKKFQRPTNEFNLAIVNPKVGGESLNWHDLDGRFTRYVMYSPDHDILKAHQARYRTCRDGSKSRTDVVMVYGKIGMRETSVLNALARKSDVMRQTLPQQVQDGIRFPGDYLDEFEPDTSAPCKQPEVTVRRCMSPEVTSN